MGLAIIAVVAVAALLILLPVIRDKKARSFPFRIARGVAIVILVFSIVLFLAFSVIDIVPKTIEVRDAQQKVIGAATIPVDVDAYLLYSVVLFVISVFQLWTLHLIAEAGAKRPNQALLPTTTAVTPPAAQASRQP